MTFGQSIGNVLSMREGFDGRASRSEFWWFALLHLAVTGAAGILDYVTGAELFVLIVLLALVLPGLGVTIRRFHDTGRSAWSLLVILVPFAAIFLFPIWLSRNGAPGDNSFGPVPIEAHIPA